jgi:xylulokinase
MDSRPGRFRWSEPLLKKYGIDAAKLPQIKESTEVAGYLSRDVAQELQLPEGIPVMVGAGDMASAAVGSGAIHPGETHVYVGTSSWIGAHLPGRKKDLSHYMGSICSAQPDLYLCIAEQETASGCLEWIRNNVVREFSHDQLNEYVSTVEPGSGGVIFTPWLFGERSPLDDPQVRSGFYNLSLEHDRGHMARAVYEGVAVNIKWALTYFQDLVEKTAPLNCIHLIGGGALSDVWCQIFADAFARPVWRMHNPLGAGARGAAAIALVGLKQFRTFSDIHHLITVDTVFKPVPEHIPIYEDILQEFQRIYKKKVSTHKSY